MTYRTIDHPFRLAIMDEVHARPVEIVPEAARVRRVVFVIPPDPGSTAAVLARFADFCAGAGIPVPWPIPAI